MTRRTKTGVDPTVPREEYLALLAKGMSEDTLLAKIRAAVNGDKRHPPLPGVDLYHTHDSRRSEAGFPDLHLILGIDVVRVAYRELKRETGRVTPEQRHVMARLEKAGADVDVWRPRHWVDGTITAFLTEHLRADRAAG